MKNINTQPPDRRETQKVEWASYAVPGFEIMKQCIEEVLKDSEYLNENLKQQIRKTVSEFNLNKDFLEDAIRDDLHDDEHGAAKEKIVLRSLSQTLLYQKGVWKERDIGIRGRVIPESDEDMAAVQKFFTSIVVKFKEHGIDMSLTY